MRKASNKLQNFDPINVNELLMRRSNGIKDIKKVKEIFFNHLGFICTSNHKDDMDDNANFSSVASTSNVLNQREAMNHPEKFHLSKQ